MNTQSFLFYAFAAILVFAGLRVITTRNTVHAALWLVLSFFSAACLWLLLQAEFLAIALVLVYVGAVMVLFLFVVMMLDVNFDKLRERFRTYIPIGATVGILILLQMALRQALVLYPDVDMRLAVSRAVAIEGPRGWRIGKDKSAFRST